LGLAVAQAAQARLRRPQVFAANLLFCHLHLRCHVVIELTPGKFEPKHPGQMGFCMTSVDRLVKAEDDTPTIGLLLCKNRNKVVAEYALSGTAQPMGIAEYQLVQSLPGELQSSLPGVEEIERELATVPNVTGIE